MDQRGRPAADQPTRADRRLGDLRRPAARRHAVAAQHGAGDDDDRGDRSRHIGLAQRADRGETVAARRGDPDDERQRRRASRGGGWRVPDRAVRLSPARRPAGDRPDRHARGAAGGQRTAGRPCADDADALRRGGGDGRGRRRRRHPAQPQPRRAGAADGIAADRGCAAAAIGQARRADHGVAESGDRAIRGGAERDARAAVHQGAGRRGRPIRSARRAGAGRQGHAHRRAWDRAGRAARQRLPAHADRRFAARRRVAGTRARRDDPLCRSGADVAAADVAGQRLSPQRRDVPYRRDRAACALRPGDDAAAGREDRSADARYRLRRAQCDDGAEPGATAPRPDADRLQRPGAGRIAAGAVRGDGAHPAVAAGRRRRAVRRPAGGERHGCIGSARDAAGRVRGHAGGGGRRPVGCAALPPGGHGAADHDEPGCG